jgi:hypothetical protein
MVVSYNTTMYGAKAIYSCPVGQLFEAGIIEKEVSCVTDDKNSAFAVWQIPGNCTGKN